MKKTTIKTAILATALMLAGATLFAQESVQVESAQSMGDNPYASQSILTMKNNTGNNVSVSFVYFDPIDQCWISRGWRNIAAYGTDKIDFGVYTGNVYIGAHAADNSKWGHGHWFCVEQGGQGTGFRIKHPENTSGCQYKLEYSRVEIAAG